MDETQLRQWMEHTGEDPALAAELQALTNAGDAAALRDRFYRTLAFGTGGLRGLMGAGTNRINAYTVGQATQGLAQYLLRRGLPQTVAIAYDSRRKSHEFARHAARVLAANGITALLFSHLAPTPLLSFAVRRHGCGAGICVTASHNPADYNGYKVYGPDGCQITEDAAAAIAAAIQSVDVFTGVKRMGLEEAAAAGRILPVPAQTEEAYLQAVQALRMERAPNDTLRVVYTPLHGAGLACVTRALRAAGVQTLHVVPQQAQPDGHFPTCPCPNPEEPAALRLGMALCKTTQADLLLATDPDCDRVGVAVRRGGAVTRLSGNEVGVLLLDYICRKRGENGAMPPHPVAIKTIVTTEMAARVARHYGVELRSVLTGFKYIGGQIGLLEAAGQAGRFVFGFEESCGYLSGTHVRDKDGVNACLLLCDMAQDYKRQNKTLLDGMEELYARFGHYRTALDAYTFPGEAGMGEMRALMAKLRQSPPASIGEFAVEQVADYRWDTASAAPAPGLPPADVLQYHLSGGQSLTVRPSGTEPKLKLYASAVGGSGQQAEQNLQALRAAAKRLFRV